MCIILVLEQFSHMELFSAIKKGDTAIIFEEKNSHNANNLRKNLKKIGINVMSILAYPSADKISSNACIAHSSPNYLSLL